MRACNWVEARPRLQAAFGADVEELIYLFPSAHASIYREDGEQRAREGEVSV